MTSYTEDILKPYLETLVKENKLHVGMMEFKIDNELNRYEG